MSRTISATFPGTIDQVRLARHCLGAWLGPDHPTSDTAMLLLSETFTNGTLYAKADVPDPPIRVRAVLERERLRVQVTDVGGNGGPSLQPLSDATDEGGRGLALLDLIADEWGYRAGPSGHVTVWFILTF